MNEPDWYWRTKLEAVGRALTKNGITVVIAGTGQEARDKILAMIPAQASVGVGGSRTMVEIGLLDALRSGGYGLIDQYDPKLSKEAAFKARRDGLHADYFVAGTNAVTEDGKLVNVDGLGNRVAGFAFGPEKVVIVVGRNKIVKDVEAALERVKNLAAPMNAKRFGAATPCATTGRCSDCDSAERICNLTLIIEKQRIPARMTVVLINEELGF
jgi:L-lactate utilization protein LutB